MNELYAAEESVVEGITVSAWGKFWVDFLPSQCKQNMHRHHEDLAYWRRFYSNLPGKVKV